MHSTVRTAGQIARLPVRLALLFTLVIVGCMGSPLHAEVYVYQTQLTTFSPRDRDLHNRTGWAPVGELVQTADGLFYGVTSKGGANGSGVVFAYDRNDGSTPIRDLYSFSAMQEGTATHPPTNADGGTPLAGLVLGADGYLYGTTSEGGPAVQPSVTVSVTPATVTAGASSPTLTWSSSGAQTCTASGTWSGTQSPSGSMSLTNLQPGSYTYSLTCTGPGGSANASASLQVNAAASGGGGGGAMSPLSLLVFGGLVLIGQIRRILANRRSRAVKSQS